MKNKGKILFVTCLCFAAMLLSCIGDSPSGESNRVVYVKPLLIGAKDDAGRNIYLREGVLDNADCSHVQWPCKYQDEITEGTEVKWKCRRATSYRKAKEWIEIEWSNE